ncbi:hypothetical protein A2819_02705 [Candidatus Azambacteria bacterium RIFCSPHIGHO2_01_FULL_40_24]|uniref:BioF2-like acetyltransferase domain-containing protein n=1 Tax=Candidatus Azambacteria bacterium RIFCSPHIGHO2_01_FULL_40_24 TaxID=1797301 RepID=A0A1F5B2T9_9BACT|nr:MAG: hypothetical protein A2819_02705 [Candidatus Azambacteria bacterium RIFCSPHIGHO2_01_FULL_40_24]
MRFLFLLFLNQKTRKITIMFKFREIKNKAEYNPLLITENAPFTQAWFFGQWQEKMGRKVRRFEIKQEEEIIGFFHTIKYPMPFGQSFLYIPHGPVIYNIQFIIRNSGFLKEFRKKLIEIVKEENAIFVRFDPFLPRRSFSEGGFDPSKYFNKTPIAHYHSSHFQPKYEWIIGLTNTEEELVNKMHPKNRYSIKLAERRGVKIKIVSENFERHFDDFYKLLNETAQRHNFNLHPKPYYQNIFKTLDSNNAFLAVAEYDGKILLINLILLYGKTAYFLFGGSSGEHKNLMFSHLTQWEAIREAKKRGFKIYNFGGVDNNGNYKTYGGISTFKKRFGGELLEHSDSYDLVLKTFWYKLYNLRKWVSNQ